MIILLYALLGFVILVFFHELGHFAVARLFGITVEEFAVGMGPILFQKHFKGTLYKICLIPLGGYCKIKGQEDFGSTNRNIEKDSFYGKNAWVRFCVVAAGPLFSFILGFLLISFTFMINGENRLKYTTMDPSPISKAFKAKDEVVSINGNPVHYWDEVTSNLIKNIGNPNTVVVKRDGKLVTINNYTFDPSITDPLKADFLLYYRSGPTMILKTQEKSPASTMGIEFGDIITSINGTPIRTELDIVNAVSNSKDKVNIILHRYKDIKTLLKKDPNFYENPSNKYEILNLTLIPEIKDGHKLIGIKGFYTFEGKEVESKRVHINISFFGGFAIGFSKSWEVIQTNALGIVKLLEGNKIVTESLSGPIRIFYQVGKLSQNNGFTVFLYIIGVISLALAFFNLIPFPALDGGHMLISVIEGIIRRPVNPKFLNFIQLIGISLLLLLFVFVSFRDIRDIFFK